MYRQYLEAEILSGQPLQIKCVASISCLKDRGYTENTKLAFIIRELFLSGLETSKLQNVTWRVEYFFKWFHL